MIALAALDKKLEPNERPKEFDLSQSIPQSEDTGFKQFPEFASKRKRKQPKAFDRYENSEQAAGTDTNELGEHHEQATAQTQSDLSRFD